MWKTVVVSLVFLVGLVLGLGLYPELHSESGPIEDTPVIPVPEPMLEKPVDPLQVSIVHVHHAPDDNIIAIIDWTEPQRLFIEARGSDLVIVKRGSNPDIIPIVADGNIFIYNSRVYLDGGKTRLLLNIMRKDIE